MNNFDNVLFEVGSAVRDHFAPNLERDGAFFLPLIRSLVTGGGFYVEGPELSDYLERVEDTDFNMCEFREDKLCSFWVGGHFAWKDLMCLP